MLQEVQNPSSEIVTLEFPVKELVERILRKGQGR